MDNDTAIALDHHCHCQRNPLTDFRAKQITFLTRFAMNTVAADYIYVGAPDLSNPLTDLVMILILVDHWRSSNSLKMTIHGSRPSLWNRQTPNSAAAAQPATSARL